MLLAQLATAVHAAEHPFHAATEICDQFLAAEHNDDTLLVSDVVITADVPTVYSTGPGYRFFKIDNDRLTKIRAPPTFLTHR